MRRMLEEFKDFLRMDKQLVEETVGKVHAGEESSLKVSTMPKLNK